MPPFIPYLAPLPLGEGLENLALHHVQKVPMHGQVAAAQTYRIEVLKAYAPASAPYTAQCWEQKTVRVPPAALVLPSQIEHEDVTIWVRHPFASPVEGKSAKGARALNCLAAYHAPAPV